MKEISAKIAELRELIDAVDDEIILLIKKRIKISTELMELKPPSETIDSGREEAIVQRYFGHLSTSSTLPKVRRLVAGIIGASKTYPGS